MEMYPYDLSHYSFQASKIGRLMTLSTIPIVAGDEMQVNLAGVFRLSPLRRNLTVDAKVDLFAFYVPYRHIYGDTWIDFMKDGQDANPTLATVEVPSGGPNAAYLGASYMGDIPAWLPNGYIRIWNRYFRVPTDDNAILAEDQILGGPLDDRIDWGQECAYLPTIWNTGVDPTVDSSDIELDVSGGDLDLLALARQKYRLRTERRREFYGRRYNDILRTVWGTTVNIDADERPELIARQSLWMSGYDVDGTDDATLGQYSGKAAMVGNFRMPRKRFAEHGTLWFMCLVRFPTLHLDEVHYLTRQAAPNYVEIAGDPEVLESRHPTAVDAQLHFQDGVTSLDDVGIYPYAQWYRAQANHIHPYFQHLDGYPFIEGNLTSKDTIRYIQPGAYDKVFQTTQLGHWQSQIRIDVAANRCIPPVERSIFAGSTP
jgi:hypothetical protein